MMKRFLAIPMAIFLVGALILTSTTQSAAKPVTLKMVSFLPKNFAAVHFLGVFADLVNQKSNGSIKVDWVGGPEVIAMRDQPRAVMNGVVDIASFPGHWEISQAPGGAVSLALSQLSHEQERANGYSDYLVQDFKKANEYYLGRMDGHTSFYIFLNKKIAKPSDLAGLKMATGGLFIQMARALKANAVTINFSEIYTSLQQGVVNSVAMLLTDCVDWKWYEVTKYWVDTPLYTASNEVLLMNLDKFNSLSPDQQALLTSSAIEVEKQVEPYFARAEDAARKTLIEKGMKPITFSRADAAAYTKLALDARWALLKGKVDANTLAKLKRLTAQPE